MRCGRLLGFVVVAFAALAVSSMASSAVASPYLSLTWTRAETTPVLSVGPVGTWDHYGAIPGSVLEVGSTYHMFYTGNDGSVWAIGHATSSDGVTWTKDPQNPILSGAQSPVVIEDGGLFKMWWVNDLIPSYSINYATSTNGTTWSQYAGNPVLTVSTFGWDSSLITTGAILHDASGYRLWYTGTADHAVFQGGLATSPDGTHWAKFAGNPVLRPDALGNWTYGFLTPCTIFSDGTALALWYVGGMAGAWRLGVAVSQDGVNWTGTNRMALGPNPTSWDGDGISRASVLRASNNLWMWYAGMGGGVQQVGLAKASYPYASNSTSRLLTETDLVIAIAIVVAGSVGGAAVYAVWSRSRSRGP